MATSWWPPGDGTTDGTNNGLGNVIVGYNADNGDTRTGSHNVVIGDQHSWTSSASLLAGLNNILSGEYSFIAGGVGNEASGTTSFVGGGQHSTANGVRSFVGGGFHNTVSGVNSFVGGGANNTAGPGTCGFVIATLFGTC
jgi:hypothetical protein